MGHLRCPIRHCERSDAIHRAASEEWIASSLALLAMRRLLAAPLQKQNAGARKNPAPALHPSQSLRGVVAGDRLDLEIFFQAVFAPFAAVAGLLVSAERRGAVGRHALPVGVAGARLAADLAGALDGVGGDVPRQTIGRVVGDP